MASLSPEIPLEPRHCTLCGPKAGKRVKYPMSFSQEDLNAAVFSARRMPDRRHFRLVQCEGCEMIFSDPACDPGVLSRLYGDAVVNYDRQASQIYDSYSQLLDHALPWNPGRGTFLEIGGGTGFMLRWGAKNGFSEQVEVEASVDGERKFEPPSPKARFVRGIFGRGLLPPSSVSLACFFQMLDHVPSPAAFLADVFEVLEPGGVAVCVTHNTAAWSAKLLGERSPIFDIEHTYLFNPDNLSRLFKQAGFERTETFTVYNDYSLRYWLHLAPLPAKKSLLIPLAEKARLAGIRLKLNAGNFGIIARKASRPGTHPSS